MNVEILLSCMHQHDTSIVTKSNITCDAVIVNQCDDDQCKRYEVEDIHGNSHHINFISTRERGLSRSRNMAIHNATATICVIADDDEIFSDDASKEIIQAYEQHPEADVIICDVSGTRISKNINSKSVQKVGYLKALQVTSAQITFKRESILKNGIYFDIEMGSGTGHGCGEENKFLYDCLHAHLNIIHVPITIAHIEKGNKSMWFKGFTPRFFLERGWATARYMGKPMAVLYAIYYALRKKSLYGKDTSMAKALTNMLKGIFSKTI